MAAGRSRAPAAEPPPEVVREYIRCWEARDLFGLVALLRKDVVFAMPPWRTWFRGQTAVRWFLQTPRFTAFWSSGLRVLPTRANGQLALAFFVRSPAGAYLRHSIELPRFQGARLAEVTTFVGAAYLRSFQVPERIEGPRKSGEQFAAGRLS